MGTMAGSPGAFPADVTVLSLTVPTIYIIDIAVSIIINAIVFNSSLVRLMAIIKILI